jgi:hypothetical protein
MSSTRSRAEHFVPWVGLMISSPRGQSMLPRLRSLGPDQNHKMLTAGDRGGRNYRTVARYPLHVGIPQRSCSSRGYSADGRRCPGCGAPRASHDPLHVGSQARGSPAIRISSAPIRPLAIMSVFTNSDTASGPCKSRDAIVLLARSVGTGNDDNKRHLGIYGSPLSEHTGHLRMEPAVPRRRDVLLYAIGRFGETSVARSLRSPLA